MKTLSREEKEELKLLVTHRWFKILERIVDDFEIDTLRQLKNVDLSNDKDVEILKKNTLYLKWAESLMRIIKSQTNVLAKKDF